MLDGLTEKESEMSYNDSEGHKTLEISDIETQKTAFFGVLINRIKNFFSVVKEDVNYKESIHSLEMVYFTAQESDTKGFYINSHKVSNGEYQRFVFENNYPKPPHWVDGNIPEGLEDNPVVNVTFEDARKFAEWRGGRLPTTTELMQAAQSENLLSDVNDFINEWATDTTDNNSPKIIQGHLRESITSSYINESNAFTGFRCASDE